MNNAKEVGGHAEARFAVEALERGFSVCKPFIDARKYDFILEKQGRFIRVQVKSTSCLASDAKDGAYSLRVVHGAAKTQVYTKKEIDLIACYIRPLNLFYIIPIAALGAAKRISLYPFDPNSKYEAYKGNWLF